MLLLLTGPSQTLAESSGALLSCRCIFYVASFASGGKVALVVGFRAVDLYSGVQRWWASLPVVPALLAAPVVAGQD